MAAAAWSWLIAAGTGTRCSSGAATYSAYDPRVPLQATRHAVGQLIDAEWLGDDLAGAEPPGHCEKIGGADRGAARNRDDLRVRPQVQDGHDRLDALANRPDPHVQDERAARTDLRGALRKNENPSSSGSAAGAT